MEANGEIQRTIDTVHYYAGKAADIGGRGETEQLPKYEPLCDSRPRRVVSVITPWNYPIAIPAWKIAPALVTGNAVVFKPVTNTGITAVKLVKCIEDAGLPGGVLNLVTGPGSAVGDVVASDDRVDAVSFTGSASVGDIVYQNAAENQTRTLLKLSGKNSTVVLPDADMDEAVDIVASGAFGVTGQACTACSRAIVHDDIYDEFVERFTGRAEDIEIGAGLDDPDMGPQSSESELSGTLDYIEKGREEGATLETGDGRPASEALSNGYFVEPTVSSGVDPEMTIAQHEIFGPEVAVIPVRGSRMPSTSPTASNRGSLPVS